MPGESGHPALRKRTQWFIVQLEAGAGTTASEGAPPGKPARRRRAADEATAVTTRATTAAPAEFPRSAGASPAPAERVSVQTPLGADAAQRRCEAPLTSSTVPEVQTAAGEAR